MAKVYLGLGTNLGNKEENLRLTAEKLEERIGVIISLSAFYITGPWGFDSVNSFFNAVCCIETNLFPFQILEETQLIEKKIGRNQKSVNGVYADRLIDIDLLLYDNLKIESERLTLPHPLMTERRFVMEPLAEIAPQLKHPTLGRTMKELFDELVANEHP